MSPHNSLIVLVFKHWNSPAAVIWMKDQTHIFGVDSGGDTLHQHDISPTPQMLACGDHFQQ